MIKIEFTLNTIEEAALVTTAVNDAVRNLRAMTKAAEAANVQENKVGDSAPAAVAAAPEPKAEGASALAGDEERVAPAAGVLAGIVPPLPTSTVGSPPDAPSAEGQPAKRGPGRPRKSAAAPTADPLFVQNTAAPAPVEVQATDTSSPVAAVPSLAQVQAAIEAVFKTRQSAVTMAVMQRWGVLRGRDVREEDRAEFMDYCAGVASGKIDPVTGANQREVMSA